MAILVDKTLSLHKQLPRARTPQEQTALERQIEATDRQIDALVYLLDESMEEESGIVEVGMNGGHRGRITLTIIPQSPEEDDQS